MTKKFATVLILLTCFSYALATPTSRGSVPQEPAKHPIDKALDACTDKNGSTAGMVECTDKAYAAWDKELNKNYGLLMQNLKPQQKEALKAAQLEWIKQRDQEFKFIDSVYDALRRGRCTFRCASRRAWTSSNTARWNCTTISIWLKSFLSEGIDLHG